VTDKLIIRTSDRESFRRCRQAWDFGSKIRQNWDYVPGVEPLDFGTAIHAALEVYYDPRRWGDDRSVVEQEGVMAFSNHMADWKRRLHKSRQWDMMEDEWRAHNVLGRGVLKHFYTWAPVMDDQWEPLKSELEFEVPIPIPDGFVIPVGWGRSPENNLLKVVDDKLIPVVYQGRIDLIARNIRTNKVYIIDHKTRGQFGDYEHYELDTQASSYAWVLKKILKIDVHGIIFQELRKKAPQEPKVLKRGALSKDKGQSTTAEIYRAAVLRAGHPIAEYEDFITFLETEGQQYFRRIQVDRSEKELEIIGRNVIDEAIDMLDNPRIYPSPSGINCNGCRYREPCLMKQDGSDSQYYLDHSLLYERRS